jgi:outer membrane protein assembly factor BamB
MQDKNRFIDPGAVHVRRFEPKCPWVRASGGRPTFIGNAGLNNVGRWLAVGACLSMIACATGSRAADWSRFRGDNGTGISSDAGVPLTWSDAENVKWKTELPGRGVSSPIVVGDKVFVTCYSGYGMDAQNPGNMEDLKRHLVCVNRQTGAILWSKTVAATMPEDPYSGIGVPCHGYASSTPASDGERIYAFFGKSGVVAFDMDGNQLWQTQVGTESGPQRWGSAASPILFENLVIINASDEGEAMVGLDKKTGKEVWRAEAAGLSGTWATPILMEGQDGVDLVIAVPGEIWGLNAQTGKLQWYAEGFEGRGMCASLVAGDGVVYCIGGNPFGSSFAVRTGGKGNVTDSHVAWDGQGFARISTPVLHNGHLYGSSRGVAFCVNAETGQRVFQARLATGEAVAQEQAGPGGPGGRGFGGPRGGRAEGGPFGGPGGGRGRGGFGGGFGAGDYGSSVASGGKVYRLTTAGVTYVFEAKPEFTLLAKNQLESDQSGFDSTPAISDGQLFLRSHKYLYCISGD